MDGGSYYHNNVTGPNGYPVKNHFTKSRVLGLHWQAIKIVKAIHTLEAQLHLPRLTQCPFKLICY
jgi:hypothetical protein